MKTHVILAAAGSGVRFGAGINKVFAFLAGIPVLKRSIFLFEHIVDSMTIVCRPADLEEARKIVNASNVSFPIQVSKNLS